MNTPRSRHHRLYVYFLAIMVYSNIAIAAEQTYVREYTYQASEADSKLSARAIALQEVKRELLSELGTHVSSLVKQQSSSVGTQLGTVEIETLSAGVTRVEIMEEKWNGVVYVLKAQIKADPEDVLKSLHKMLDADKKQKQISQLGGDLSKIRTENIQIAESLTQSKKETTAALAEIARLKKQLAEKQTDDSREKLNVAYKNQATLLSLNELVDSAIKNYAEGNYTEAFKLFSKAADQGSAFAQASLGFIYKIGKGVPQNNAKAVEWWKKAADQGIASAQSNLGQMYYYGKGVSQNNAKAVEWYQKAADQGYVEAQFNLGFMYLNGKGIPQNTAKAVEWFLKAADQGFAEAQFSLGVLYEKREGLGIPQNNAKAVEWYQKAADQGYAEAQINLGLMYYNGKGIPQNTAKAEEWYQKAADQGYAALQAHLGLMYYNGKGIPQNTAKAVEWWKKAADQGYAEAQYNLGLMYANGEGVTRDAKQAVYWFQKAAEQGDAEAQRLLNRIKGTQ